jgi:formamidopyrimidine-DNA glycosylase
VKLRLVPEYPDIVVYIEALEKRILNGALERVQISSPFLLRTAVPPLSSVTGKKVVKLRRLGKRICIGFEEDYWIVFHLMIAGRLHWKERVKPAKPPSAKSNLSKTRLAAFDFENGTLTLTEAGTQKRASLHVFASGDELKNLDAGGLELFTQTESAEPGYIDKKSFATVLQSSNHTLKRALTDPRLFSGIGNAYSDEILFAARLSPIKLTQKLDDGEIERLYAATRDTLIQWAQQLREEAGEGFPEKVTAFREGMAVHGRYRLPCPRCGSKVQRIRYATNETNYCPVCQTDGKLLADRALSRILRSDWPKSAEELG